MITVLFDMDQVVCDFDSYYEGAFDKVKFRNLVMNEKMFEKLGWTPNGLKFFNAVHTELEDSYLDYNIQFLSSLGSPVDKELQLESARQKLVWLKNNGLDEYHANFPVHKGLKKRFATPNSILVDDIAQNIFDFNEHFGHGLLYNDAYFEANIKEFGTLLNKVIQNVNSNIIEI